MIDEKSPLDLVVQIMTPENIRFEYHLAGPFRRFQAMMIDIIIKMASLIVLGIGLSFLLGLLGMAGVGSLAGVFLSAFIIILWFLFDWFYGLFFESWMNGQTPGKRTLGLRVISIDGRPINAVQATIRNFLRVADLAPMISLEVFSPEMPPAYMIPTFLVGLVTMTMTLRMQRLGDMAAGTMVVIDEKNWYPKYAHFEDQRVMALAEYIPAGFQMSRTMAKAVALYVDRRGRFSPARRTELAASLAVPIHQKFGFRPDTSPDLTLCALYYKNFVAAEFKGVSEKLRIQESRYDEVEWKKEGVVTTPIVSNEIVDAEPLEKIEPIELVAEKSNENR